MINFEHLEPYWKNKNIQVLCKYYFPKIKPTNNLTPTQISIIRKIVFSESCRLCINAMTRYGKSFCVAIAVSLYILCHKNKKVAIIAPQDEQAGIIRNYIAELIIDCKELTDILDIEIDKSIERLKKETSRRRWTFKNGCELRTISAHGEANRLMGFGADLTIKDESCLISNEANTKIMRMLGDNPESSILIELANPWSRDNKYYEHYSSGRFEVINIDYNLAIKEGRTNLIFIEEMRKELTPIEFCVLYESRFPDEEVNSLFKFEWINRAMQKEKLNKGRKVISADIAGSGLDKTVIMIGYEENGFYSVNDILVEDKSNMMGIANRIFEIGKDANIINIDCIGIGAGVISRLRELFANSETIINPCHFGESPQEVSTELDKLPASSKKRFLNKKAENYFRLRSLFEDGKIILPDNAKLRSEAMMLKWERSVSEKIRIIDPENFLTDHICALCYFIWRDTKESECFWG